MPASSALDLTFPSYTNNDLIRRGSTLQLEHEIFSVISEFVQPSNIPVTTTAKNICKLVPFSAPTASVDFFALEGLWNLFVIVAEQIPWNHPSQDKVVDLIKAIRDLPDANTVTITGWDEDPVSLWKDLPVLSLVLADNVESHGIIIHDDSEEEKQSRLRDVNFQGFAARMTTSGVYRLRDLLEEDPDCYIAVYAEIGPHLDACIHPANVWVSLAAHHIYQACKRNGGRHASNGMAGGKHWKGQGGFSVERWRFWKDKLDEIAMNDQASRETRAIAKKMQGTMTLAENRHT